MIKDEAADPTLKYIVQILFCGFIPSATDKCNKQLHLSAGNQRQI